MIIIVLNTFNRFLMKKIILFTSFITTSFQLLAQWSGPTNGFLSTGNNVKIASIPTSGMPGTTIPPLFDIQSLATVPISVFSVDYDLVNVGKPLSLNNTSLTLKRANATLAFQLLPLGNLTITTDGNPIGRGLFLKSPTADILSVTSTELAYTGNAVIKTGDLMIKDVNGDVQLRLYNDGLIRAREVKVNMQVIPPDYVFETNYKLMGLKQLEDYIKAHKHLPNIPSAKEFTDAGSVDINVLQFKLLEKVEELTLYIIQLQKENELLAKRLCELEQAK